MDFYWEAEFKGLELSYTLFILKLNAGFCNNSDNTIFFLPIYKALHYPTQKHAFELICSTYLKPNNFTYCILTLILLLQVFLLGYSFIFSSQHFTNPLTSSTKFLEMFHIKHICSFSKSNIFCFPLTNSLFLFDIMAIVFTKIQYCYVNF